MKVDEVCRLLDGNIICGGDSGCNPVKVYAGDFLSRVMGKAPPDSVWLTIMTNVNVAAVATLADVKIVVLCEGVKAEQLLVNKCLSEDIALISTDLSVYDACKRL